MQSDHLGIYTHNVTIQLVPWIEKLISVMVLGQIIEHLMEHVVNIMKGGTFRKE